VSSLESLTLQRISLFNRRFPFAKSQTGGYRRPSDIVTKDLAVALERAAIMQKCATKSSACSGAQHGASRFFSLTVAILVITFAASRFLFSIHYLLLNTELEARAQAEQSPARSEISLQHLTSRLLQMQDEDAVSSPASSMTALASIWPGCRLISKCMPGLRPNDALLASAIGFLDDSIAETRTISHLLHPHFWTKSDSPPPRNGISKVFPKRSGFRSQWIYRRI